MYYLLTLCRRALNTWGVAAQIDQCVEEMAELTVELQHAKRGRVHHAAEEIADVMICVQQMRVVVGPDEVDEQVRRKLERLAKRLDEVEG